MKARKHVPAKINLAYSGGLDTSVILPWLKERYPGVKIVAFVADLGQGEEELAGIEEKARRSGADEVVVQDLSRVFAEEFCFPMLRAHAVYEEDYLLGTSIARPAIAEHQVRVAHETGCDAVAHGATGKGNDQVRFELTYKALDPDLMIIAPWKDPDFQLTSREAALEYAAAKGIPVQQSRTKIYSRDRNLWHISHEGADLEDPANEPQDGLWTISVPVSQAPAEPRYVELAFEQGTPVAVDGERLPGDRIIARLNAMGGQHAVGQVQLVENRLVGMKSRGAYETPGGTILYEAHKALEHLCLERDTYRYKQQVALKYGEMVYYGQWFHPLREALQAFVDHTQQVVTGTVRLKLFKGRVTTAGVTSPMGIYNPELASFTMGDFDVTAGRGFIDLLALPMQTDRQRLRKGL